MPATMERLSNSRLEGKEGRERVGRNLMALRPPFEGYSLVKELPSDQEHLGLFYPCPSVQGTGEHSVGARNMIESRAELKRSEHQEARLRQAPGPGTKLPVSRPPVSTARVGR